MQVFGAQWEARGLASSCIPTTTASGPEFDAMVARKLANPDWRYLRTDRQ